MTRRVPHFRPEIGTFNDMHSGDPVSAVDWATLAQAANWVHGRGAQVLPWTAVGIDVADAASKTLRYYFQSKRATVARVWSMVLLSDTEGATATVTINGTAFSAERPPTDRESQRHAFTFVEQLGAKKTGLEVSTVALAAAGGDISIESIGCFDVPRHTLDNDEVDWGVDVNRLRARQPALRESIGRVCDAEAHMSARRPTHAAWAVSTADGISPGSTSFTEMFNLPAPVQGAMDNGATSQNVRCYVFAKVSSGTGQIKFTAGQTADTVTIDVTQTSFDTDWANLEIETEDLTASNGRRSGLEDITVEAKDPAGQTLTIAGVYIIREGARERRKV